MSHTLRILLAEDCETDAKLILLELRRMAPRVEMVRVETEHDMRAALQTGTWDAILSDWSMPRFSALAALAVARDTERDLPFIIVSGTIGEEVAVEAMRAGAHDFVLKDKLGRLCPALERAMREARERGARRQAETALRQSEARFRRLAESGIIGIVISDVHGRIHEANNAYLNLVGYSRQELLNGVVRWTDLTPPELAHQTAHALEQLEARGVVIPWETETLRKDGSRVPILVGAALLEHPLSIAFIADLSERQQAQAGRRKAEEALRRSEDQLRQSQKMEAVGRLAGGVAHDFNNVLTVILGYGSLIQEDLSPTDPLRADIEEICKAATGAAGLTRQLLLFSQQHVIEKKVIDPHALLTSLERMMKRLMGEDVALELRAPTTPGRIEANPTNIEQIVMNLLVNARDAMPTGGKLIIESDSVVLDEAYAAENPTVKAGPYVMIAVSDTGTGMDHETQAHIFEPFFTTKEVGKGTGLGLSTVFGIVQQSGGHIRVDSAPGRGTSFKIYLPRVAAEVDSERPHTTPATLRGTESILLVEDEEQVRKVAVNILLRQGYRVIPARSAAEALQLSKTHEGLIDLLLTDVVMPDMSGPELARRLAVARPEKFKVLCMSGYTDDSIVRHGVLQSGVALLQKPLTPLSLATKIREVLDEG